jgi:ribonuclease-3
LGAIYLDGGYQACRKVILEMFEPAIRNLPDVEQLKDAKTRLQEHLQARGRPLPEYALVNESGADHAKQFTVRCVLPDDGEQAEATGNSLRKAEQAAAAMIQGRLSKGRE